MNARNSGRPGGLPSNPRAGARPTAQRHTQRAASLERSNAKDVRGRAAASAPPHQYIRPQKSMGALSTRNRSPAPPVPIRKRSISRPRHAPSASASASSASSFASSASFFDRIKGQTGYASSRTSFEDDGANAGFKGEGEPSYSREDNVRYSVHSSNGDGSTVWSRVAAAAGNLTINVSKTWAASIATYTGEYTPPGQESRLLRGMKAYHLAKARDPSDLPSWLFEPHERGRLKREDRQGGDEGDPNPRASSYKEPPKPRSLRDVYEAAAATSSPTPRTIRGADGNEARPSRATDRLQAMRQARRGVVRGDSPDASTVGGHVRSPQGSVDGRRNITSDDGERRVPRMGLPSRPARKG
ncbi:hypothetical protein CCMSSC00406_0003226 [Pleurotus cornucopiae]|uniref:Uncharacterized protein n=1 Tax=Pleurotus cornucopiae TaxID=5321 RepID=A0ACB7J6X5_PLECO|nr:hypothetical protein CCMSSC00406_0003226 [Pleurotus cornucopiae]